MSSGVHTSLRYFHLSRAEERRCFLNLRRGCAHGFYGGKCVIWCTASDLTQMPFIRLAQSGFYYRLWLYNQDFAKGVDGVKPPICGSQLGYYHNPAKAWDIETAVFG